MQLIFHRFVAGVAAMLLALAAGTASAADKPTIHLAYINGWDDSIATTHVAAEIIRERLGYPVKLTPVDVAMMYLAIARGDLDATLSAWLPVSHRDYYQRNESKLTVLGTNTLGRVGLVVPDYVSARSIEDLKADPQAYDRRIVGIEAGGGVMRLTQQAIADYGLDVQLMASSTPAMTTALARAIRAQKPIVVTGWVPHWKFVRFKLRFLDDPNDIYGASERVDIVANRTFATKAPEAAAFLAKFNWQAEDVGEVMLAMIEGQAPEQAAKAWVAAHPQRVAAWLP